MHFNTAYPALWIIAGLLLAAFASYLLYKGNPLRLEKKWMEYGVMAFRFLTLFIICLLLLEPMIRWVTQRKEKPILVFAVDNSESMIQNRDSAFVRNELTKQLNDLKDAVTDRFDVETYTLGEKAEKNENIQFNEKLTNLSDALVQIENDHYNLNHVATVLFSDGIFNQGSNPAYALQKGAAPVYTIGLGDTTQHKDALIGKVHHNATVFAGNDFEINVDCKAFFCNNEILNLSVSEGNEIIFNGSLTARGNNYFGTQKIIITKAKEGIHTYHLSIAPVRNESNLTNNKMQIQVNVLREKQKIVLLYQTPHPDIRALIRSLENNPNYALQSILLSDYKDESIEDASLFILHQIPGSRGEGVKLLQRLQQKNMPLFFITGRQTGLSYLGSSGTLRITGPGQNFNESQPVINDNFSLFRLDEDLTNTIRKFAPLITPYGDYQMAADASVLLYQQIGNVKTDLPLLFFSSSKGYNQAYLCGEGYWRWHLQDYLLNQNQQNTQAFISKIVQWLAGKNDRSKFRVNPVKKFFDENEPVIFDADLFNDLYERINEPDISLTLKNKEDKVFNYQFSKTEKAYRLDLGNLIPGEYRYEARVNGNQKYETKSGQIHVKALQTEALQTRADHLLLKSVASETGGKFYLRNQFEDLKKDLLANENMKTVVYEQEEMKDLLTQKWIFFFILLLLTTEWMIRKWNGFI